MHYYRENAKTEARVQERLLKMSLTEQTGFWKKWKLPGDLSSARKKKHLQRKDRVHLRKDRRSMGLSSHIYQGMFLVFEAFCLKIDHVLLVDWLRVYLMQTRNLHLFQTEYKNWLLTSIGM